MEKIHVWMCIFRPDRTEIKEVAKQNKTKSLFKEEIF